MNSYDDDVRRTEELLARALSEEAAGVDPRPGALQQIQRRTARPSRSRTPWLMGALGAAVATAAVITAVVVIGDTNDVASNGTPAATQPATSANEQQVDENGMHQGVYDPQADPSSQVTVYYLGRASGPSPFRVFGETHTVQGYDGSQLAAVRELLTSRPIDPDYTNPWPEGLDVEAVSVAESTGVTTVALTSDVPMPLGSVYDASDPANFYRLGLQSMARTLGLSPGEQLALTFNGDSTGHGLEREPLPAAVGTDDEVRAFITIDNIVEGQTVTNPVTVKASGNTFEANLNWQLLDADGRKLDEGSTMVGSYGEWSQADIDLGTLEPGTYTFEALEYSAEDGSVANSDDKTFTVS